jgi:hypothetical protein
MKPVVFLDMDGVICTRLGGGWSRNGKPLIKRAGRLFRRAIDIRTVAHLNDLCQASGAIVVVSSSWRITSDVRAFLRTAGYKGEFHIEWRTDADGPTRGQEIGRWLLANSNPPFVVLDDWLSGLEDYTTKLVLTDGYCGLTALDAARAVDIVLEQQVGTVLAKGRRMETPTISGSFPRP